MPKLVRQLVALLRWSDPSIHRIGRNALHLIGSNALQSVLGLIASVIVARSLGVHEFGILALIAGYCAVVTQLINFQTIYAVIQIGTSARESGSPGVYLGVLRLGMWLDVLAALLAACLAVLGAWIAMHWFKQVFAITDEHVFVVGIFSIGIVTGVVGAPTAILRMRDRYNAFLWHGAISGITKVVLTVAALLLGGGLVRFAAAAAAATAVANLLLIGLSLREISRLRRELSQSHASFKATFRAHPELLSLLVNTNLMATMRMVRETDILIVGYLLDSSSAGIFRIARNVGSLAHKIVDPFFHAIYPDLATVNAQSGRNAVASLVRSSSSAIGIASVVLLAAFVAVGQPLLVILLGLDYAAAYLPAAVILSGAVVWAFGHPFSPALMIWGRHEDIFRVTSVCSLVYVSLVWALSQLLGVNGAAAAYPAFHALWVTAVAVLFVKRMPAS